MTFSTAAFENDRYLVMESSFGGKVLTLYQDHWSEKQAELLTNLLVVAKILIKLYLYFCRQHFGRNTKFRSVSNYGMVECQGGFIKDGHWLSARQGAIRRVWHGFGNVKVNIVATVIVIVIVIATVIVIVIVIVI